jgi:hypothetical protein
VDVTVLGGGDIAESCRKLLSGGGFESGAPVEPGGPPAVIAGDSAHVFATVRGLIEGGHHVLVACPAALSASQLDALFARRGEGQVLFLWSESRHHPGH